MKALHQKNGVINLVNETVHGFYRQPHPVAQYQQPLIDHADVPGQRFSVMKREVVVLNNGIRCCDRKQADQLRELQGLPLPTPSTAIPKTPAT
jgi:hypothetical protein